MAHAQRNPGINAPGQRGRHAGSEERTSHSNHRSRPSVEDREIERARHRNKALRDSMQEGDEGQGEWEGSARSW